MPETYDRGLRSVATDADWTGYERSARDLALQMLLSGDVGVSSPGEVHVRRIIPQWDLNAGSDSAWNGDDAIWTQQASSATNAGDEVAVYDIDSNDRMDDKTMVVYGIQDLGGGSITDLVSQLIVENRTGGTIEQFDLSQLDVAADDDYRALLENPIALSPNKSAFIRLIAQNDISTGANTPELQLHGVVADEEGQDLEASTRFVANFNTA